MPCCMSFVKERKVLTAVALICASPLGIHGQEPSEESKPKVPLVSVVGCADRNNEGAWSLRRATDGTETKRLYTSTKEIEEARAKRLGRNRYKLVGTADFVTKEELLKTQQRAEFTRPAVANATGQLQDGRKVVVKGLLITAPREKTLNLVSVQQLGAC